MTRKKRKNKKTRSTKTGLVNRIRAKQKARTFDAGNALALGNRCLQTGDLARAEQVYQKVLFYDRDNIAALYHLAIITHQTGRPQKGLPLIARILHLKPSLADAHNLLGLLQYDMNNFIAAAASFKKALTLDPDFAEAHYNFANTKWKLQDSVSAVDGYKKALDLQPDYSDALHNLGMVYIELGQFRDAENTLSNAVSLEPSMARAHRLLSKVRKYKQRNDPHIIEMEKLITNDRITAGQKKHLSFALGKAYEDTGEYERSFLYYSEGNRLQRMTYTFDHVRIEKLFNTIKSIFNESYMFSNLREFNREDITPIFILGMPRSGTSLVEQIIASHSEVHGAGELYQFYNLTLHHTSTSTLQDAMERISVTGTNIFSSLGKDYLQTVSGLIADKRCVTDKMPQNFLLLGLIRLAMPHAKIIHCLRDPLDNCFSILKNYFANAHEYAYEQKELGRYYLLYRDLMDHWLSLFPDSIYTVQYESMVHDQENETKKLLAYCSLKSEESCLLFHTTKRRVATISSAQVRMPIYKDSVHRWKLFKKQLTPLVESLEPCYR